MQTTVEKSFYEALLEGPVAVWTPKRVMSIIHEQVRLSPEQARHILRKYCYNERNPASSVVIRYASDMIANRWEATGSTTICFSKEGKLLDGKHRLLALIKSGTDQDFLITYGVDKISFFRFQNGEIPATADVLGSKEN
jgi:hypothetical protein